MADSTRPSEEDKQAERKARKREYNRQYYQKNKDRNSREKDRDRQRRWREANPEKVAATQKRYRELHKDSLRERRELRREKARQSSREHYHRNKDAYRIRRQEYRKKNSEKLSAAGKAYYAKNRNKVSEKHRQYRQENIEKTRCKNREYQRRKWRDDFEYWLKKTVGRRMRDALACHSAQKAGRTIALVGCPASTLALHLESKFLPGMSWENYGYDGWHIDHIIPLAKFDLKDPEQQAAAFHYTNLQPLWAKDNLTKSHKVEGQNLFGFAYAARIADKASATQKKRRKRGG